MAKPRDAPLARTLMVLVAKLMHAQAELLTYRLDPATEPPASKSSPSPPLPAPPPVPGAASAAGRRRPRAGRRRQDDQRRRAAGQRTAAQPVFLRHGAAPS